VTVRVAERASDDGRIPLTFLVEERAPRAVSLAGAYSTDLGISLSASWTHRNLFGNAEQLILSAAGTGLWGNATDDLGYQLSARFIKPAFLRSDRRGSSPQTPSNRTCARTSNEPKRWARHCAGNSRRDGPRASAFRSRATMFRKRA